MPAASLAARAPGGGYFTLSRAPRYSILFALPLLLAYEVLAAMLSTDGGGLRNGADVILRGLFITVAGARGQLIFFAAVILLGVWLVGRDMRGKGALRPPIFVMMFGESAVLAGVFGLVVGTLTARLLGTFALLSIGPQTGGFATNLMLSLGAGLYEELLFRVLLVSALAWLARKALGLEKLGAGIVAALVAALIFSAFHYIGPYGDPFRLQSFVFRFIAGLVFSALYLVRGFGITAWTHALYDAFLLVA
jgi:hypothetical protein